MAFKRISQWNQGAQDLVPALLARGVRDTHELLEHSIQSI